MTAAADTIDACPICGAELQGVEEIEYIETTLFSNGDVADLGTSCGSGDFRFYCANDHTESEIVEQIQRNQNPNRRN
jgi:hypothetical protein